MKIKSQFRMPYDSTEEAHTRLGGTVIRYKDEVVHVNKVNGINRGNFTLTITRDNGNVEQIRYPSDDIDLSPLPPLYTHFRNYAGTAYWVARKAVRKFQQGGCSNNTYATKVDAAPGSLPTGLSPANIMPSYNRPVDTIRYVEGLKKYGQGMNKSWALSTHVAVFQSYDDWGNNKGFGIEYRGEVIGDIVRTDGDLAFIKTDNESLSFNPWCCQRLEEVGILRN